MRMSEETYVELVPDDIELVQASEIDGTIFAIKSNFFYYFLKFAQKNETSNQKFIISISYVSDDDDDGDGDGDDDDDEDLVWENLEYRCGDLLHNLEQFLLEYPFKLRQQYNNVLRNMTIENLQNDLDFILNLKSLAQSESLSECIIFTLSELHSMLLHLSQSFESLTISLNEIGNFLNQCQIVLEAIFLFKVGQCELMSLRQNECFSQYLIDNLTNLVSASDNCQFYLKNRL